MKILIVEDDRDIAALLALYLSKENYETQICRDGLEGMRCFDDDTFDCCLLDIMLPGMNGYELARHIRAAGSVPLIFLSAKSSDNDKILGLDLGADDYIAKPFNPLEVIARVKSVLRRSREYTENQAEILCNGISLRTNSLAVVKNGQEISLTPVEYKILALLMKAPGRVFTKAQIWEQVSGSFIEGDENSVMVSIYRIREKIEDNPREPRLITTIRGLGYRFEAGNEER